MTHSPSHPHQVSVIVTEDEPLIRMLAVDALTGAGFKVMEANDADGALQILEALGSGIDILFTDINMPGSMDGLDLAHYVHDHWPSIELLVASGKATPRPADMPEGSCFLCKPYLMSQLTARIREIMSDKHHVLADVGIPD